LSSKRAKNHANDHQTLPLLHLTLLSPRRRHTFRLHTNTRSDQEHVWRAFLPQVSAPPITARACLLVAHSRYQWWPHEAPKHKGYRATVVQCVPRIRARRRPLLDALARSHSKTPVVTAVRPDWTSQSSKSWTAYASPRQKCSRKCAASPLSRPARSVTEEEQEVPTAPLNPYKSAASKTQHPSSPSTPVLPADFGVQAWVSAWGRGVSRRLTVCP